ncbi:MAG: YdeI/OmpD-associated family protein [Bacteroidota bacterium]
MDLPLIDQKYLLEKFEGKGGWTFARIPDIKADKQNYFNWVKVKGTIDGFEISKYNLTSMGNSQMFLPVRAEIRKKIKKEAGDWVHIILYPDNEPLITPEEMWLCLEDEPKAMKFYQKITESERKHYIDWIYSAKMNQTKIDRMIKAIDRLARELKMYDIGK